MTRAATQRFVTLSLIGIFLIGFGYFVYRTSHAYFSGPSLTIFAPTDYSATTSAAITVTGRASRVNDITLDGREITVDNQGNFSQTVLLSPGYNVETVFARDQFGHSVERRLEIVYQSALYPTTATTTRETVATSTGSSSVSQ